MQRAGWRSASLLAVLTVVSASVLDAPLHGAPPPPAVQASNAGGVTVKVTPRDLRAGVPSWDFDVTLETHTRPLDQDMAGVAWLVDSQGKSHAPLAWDGDPPGGHHRRGLLRFRPLAGNPATVMLEIRDVGGVAVRNFRWRRD